MGEYALQLAMVEHGFRVILRIDVMEALNFWFEHILDLFMKYQWNQTKIVIMEEFSEEYSPMFCTPKLYPMCNTNNNTTHRVLEDAL